LIDLIEGRIDVAIRVGPLAGTKGVGRKLCDLDMLLCASPAYVERHGAPGSPADLDGHHWLVQLRTENDEPPTLSFELHGGGGARAPVRAAPRITTTNQIALQQMCEQGMGIAWPVLRRRASRAGTRRADPAAARLATPLTGRDDGHAAARRRAGQGPRRTEGAEALFRGVADDRPPLSTSDNPLPRGAL
jgi:DNA-binding transcriptional LysR family regulator